jgi:hypothetical protein
MMSVKHCGIASQFPAAWLPPEGHKTPRRPIDLASHGWVKINETFLEPSPRPVPCATHRPRLIRHLILDAGGVPAVSSKTHQYYSIGPRASIKCSKWWWVSFRLARKPSRIDAKRGDHFPQANFPLLIVVRGVRSLPGGRRFGRSSYEKHPQAHRADLPPVIEGH